LKKFIVYVLFVFICAFSIFFYIKHDQSSEYEATTIPYIHQVLPQISTWDPELTKEYMAPEVLERVTPADIEKLMTSLSKLGQFQGIDEIEFKDKQSGEFITRDQKPLVIYSLETRYSNGEAKVTIKLHEKGDSYEVFEFNFLSDLLAQEKAAKGAGE